MTREQQIAAIRAKCIEANLEIETRAECNCGCQQEMSDAIRLADVLLAIAQIFDEHVLEFSGIKTCSLEAARTVAKWTLRSDDLDQQSDATISFLYSLLLPAIAN